MTLSLSVKITMAALQKYGNLSNQDPAIPLMGIYPNDALFYLKDTCPTMFIVVPLIIVRN